MKLSTRVKKEIYTFKYRARGYSRLTASRWYNRVKRDNRLYKNRYSKEELKKVHKLGYLAKNIERYNLLEKPDCNLISDLDYLALRPINNNFSKWIEDANTMQRRLPQFEDNFYKIHFSIMPRSDRFLFYYLRRERYSYKGLLSYIKKYGKPLVITPSFWNSKEKEYQIEYKDGEYYVNNERSNSEAIIDIIKKKQSMSIITDKPDFYGLKSVNFDRAFYIKIYITNDFENEDKTKILFAMINTIDSYNEGYGQQFKIDLQKGSFVYKNRNIIIPNWDNIVSRIIEISEELKPISFFSLSIALNENSFKIVNANPLPWLPRIDFSGDLNDYLNYRLKLVFQIKVPLKTKWIKIKKSLYARYVKKHCRKGMRPYMQKLWEESVLSDLKYRGTTLKEKIWAWKRGFLSFRIKQYGLTEENYKECLSDYDYHWLNRINNVYQGWINDKTTFRYTMEEFKDLIPEYYFMVMKRNGKTEVIKMPDCPKKMNSNLDGLFKTIRSKGKVVFKPSAGTHGDGFYCIEFVDSHYMVNGKVTTRENVEKVITSQKSFYVLTDYINMHEDLKKIYPKSVNSIRIMVLNEHGYKPQIMQTYIRIGSSATGYTDNVGYGGICSMIDEDGYLYNPEQLVNHEYIPCPRHPDTQTEIEGIRIPNWEIIKKGVLDICKSMPELEYLGFDVAVTEKGFNIMEINIHQDLHKVANHRPEVKEYYQRKIDYKKRIYKI